MALLRNQFENLIVPLACTVDYFGVRYECTSIPPISQNSLIYGSDNEGLIILTEEYAEAYKMA